MSRLERNHFHGGIVLEGASPHPPPLSLSPWHASAMREMGELGSSSSPSPSSSIAHSSVFHSYPLISAVLAFAIAQSIKFFTTWYKERHWDAKQLIGSGGMPSSHSATVTALALAIGIQDGLDSSAFATAAILAFVVMCDAFGVRLHAGKQAEVLNQIMYELPEEHPLSDTRPLHELLGHTPIQVIAGAALGSVVAIAAQLINRFAGGAWQSEIVNKLIDDN